MKKLLIIDDSDLERELLAEILKGSGIPNECLHARSGPDAIEILAPGEDPAKATP